MVAIEMFDVVGDAKADTRFEGLTEWYAAQRDKEALKGFVAQAYVDREYRKRVEPLATIGVMVCLNPEK